MVDIYVKKIEDTWIGLAYSEEKIAATALNYDKEETLRSLIACLPPNTDYRIVEKASEFAEKIIEASREVHLGGQPFTDFTLAAEYVPEPQAQVLKIASSIPIGYVASYGGIAKAAGTEPKTVGKIMASNPLYPIVQCHLVVGTDFSLVGYGGRKTTKALKAKLARLNKERKGHKTEREITVDKMKFRVCPVERVIAKASKQRLNLSLTGQRTLTNY